MPHQPQKSARHCYLWVPNRSSRRDTANNTHPSEVRADELVCKPDSAPTDRLPGPMAAAPLLICTYTVWQRWSPLAISGRSADSLRTAIDPLTVLSGLCVLPWIDPLLAHPARRSHARQGYHTIGDQGTRRRLVPLPPPPPPDIGSCGNHSDCAGQAVTGTHPGYRCTPVGSPSGRTRPKTTRRRIKRPLG